MSENPQLRFLSLFVPDLVAARKRYEAILGLSPIEGDTSAPVPHPFAASEPVVFDLGHVKLALYQCNPKGGTHPGDVGIGVQLECSPEELARRANRHGGRVFFGPRKIPDDGREMAVFMLPDRHFFEVLGPRDEP